MGVTVSMAGDDVLANRSSFGNSRISTDFLFAFNPRARQSESVLS